ncbi:MAG TPA: glycogen synthase GlgA [Planctomycetota bacterium]|nr:glycogen synthase GlgA [Planctomycetota bacterium]
MEIVHVASEVAPFAKTGGLADVVGALPAALARAGRQVTVIMPGYRGALAVANDALPSGAPIDLPTPVGTYRLEPLACRRDGVEILLLRCDELFDRAGLYGIRGRDYSDNALRFAIFSRAAAAIVRLSPRRPDVVHAHDWQAGLAVALVATARPRPHRPRTVFTIHNLAYQGVYDGRIFPVTGLPEEAYTVGGVEYYGDVGYLKAGLVYADALTTVSPSYSREIQTPELGRGLDGVLRQRAKLLRGIVNGIDAGSWNPATDAALPGRFHRDDLGARREVKAALLAELGLDADREAPLIAMVARLDPQKGFDLVLEAAPDLVAAGARIAILGTGDPSLEHRLSELSRRFPGKVAARLAFDDGLARRFYGGSDLSLVPSRFEPCGLNQLYSMRYGSVPIVRRTGGLADTVEDADGAPDRGTGFLFGPPTSAALLEACRRALQAFADKARFAAIQRRGMSRDDSWDVPAREYLKLYEELAAGEARGSSSAA